MLSRSWQKIDLLSRAHSGAPNASGLSFAFFTKRNSEPSAFTKPSCHALSAIIEKASCLPSGDQTGPKQLSLGIFGGTVTLLVATSAIAMWRSGPGRVFASATVL